MDSAILTNNLLRTVKSDNDWFTSLMKVDLYAPTGNSSSIETASDGSVSVTLPKTLQDIATKNIPEYQKFTCARNLPKCVANRPQPTECETRCTAISNAIGDFSAECLGLQDAAKLRY